MTLSSARNLCAPLLARMSLSLALACLLVPSAAQVFGQEAETRSATPARLLNDIDARNTVTLKGHVLKGLTSERDLGMVDDALPVHLYMSLKRTSAQQADLDALIAAQQDRTSQSYHKWLTPEQFGARFGASPEDISQITLWLSSQGFEVTGVAKNASIINFVASAAGVRETFHAQLHYWNIDGGKHVATASEPQIPAALSDLVGGIAGLNQIPPHEHHTPIHQEAFDEKTHLWHTISPDQARSGDAESHFNVGGGHYNVTPQDFYTIYNVNPIFQAGNLGAGSTIAVIGSGPFNYGTVSGGSAGGTATGGDIVTFRKLFGITTPLNLQIEHGSTNFPCSVSTGARSVESVLDVEWLSALTPAATIVFEDCSANTGGFLNEVEALADQNRADIISCSLGGAESLFDSGLVSSFDNAFAQMATQGQTFLSAQGDSGSDDDDYGSAIATHGLTIDFPGSNPLVLSVGGTDFQDLYDVRQGSSTPQSDYWGANSASFGDALGYVPEMVWDESCANSIVAKDTRLGNGLSPAAYCASGNGLGFADAGGGGVSTLFHQPSYQAGIPGLSASVTMRATPDVSLFSSGGIIYGHSVVICDSSSASTACTSTSNIGAGGGTSFAAPQFAGILGLVRVATGSRVGEAQPKLYSLFKQQVSAGTACYANGQTSNTGISVKANLPASTCIFNDVTTGNNNEACKAGSTNCFSNPGATVGVLSTTGASSLTVSYPAGVGYDIATGLGSVNVSNLINKWNGGGSTKPPAISFSVNVVNFGNEKVGTTTLSKQQTVKNIGGSTLTFSSIKIMGNDGASFSFTSNCGTGLAVGASCTVNESFTPRSKGALTANVSFVDNTTHSPQKIYLTGTGK